LARPQLPNVVRTSNVAGVRIPQGGADLLELLDGVVEGYPLSSREDTTLVLCVRVKENGPCHAVNDSKIGIDSEVA